MFCSFITVQGGNYKCYNIVNLVSTGLNCVALIVTRLHHMRNGHIIVSSASFNRVVDLAPHPLCISA